MTVHARVEAEEISYDCTCACGGGRHLLSLYVRVWRRKISLMTVHACVEAEEISYDCTCACVGGIDLL